ncbi:MAG: hypothetical protein KJO05_05085 [Bacteroidia bacterium]|nr:hypothetical protein [Bacteroidia bacterium]NNM08292.1 hypothetical protein [Flavobacteriaceae bacterium]
MNCRIEVQFKFIYFRIIYLQIVDMVNQDHLSYSSHFEYHDFSDENWIKIIQHNPEILKQPIAIRGDRTILVETPTDIIKKWTS